LDPRSRKERLVRTENEEGIEPEKRLALKLREVRAVNTDNAEGRVPTKELE
jgi:hypothetical protein